ERPVIPQLENVAVCAGARPNSIQNTQIIGEAVTCRSATGPGQASVIDHVENYDWRGSTQFPPAQVGGKGQMVLKLLQMRGDPADAPRRGLIHQRNRNLVSRLGAEPSVIVDLIWSQRHVNRSLEADKGDIAGVVVVVQ